MAFIYRDILTPSRAAWNNASALYHRFDRVWGGPEDNRTTEIIGEVEVYKKTLPFVIGGNVRNDVPFNRFLNIIGASRESIENNNYDEIELVWFYLRNNAYEFDTPNDNEIAAKLNEEFEIGQEFEVTVIYGGEMEKYINIHSLPWNLTETGIKAGELNTEEIREEMNSNPWFYFANIGTETPEDPDNIDAQTYVGLTDGTGTPIPITKKTVKTPFKVASPVVQLAVPKDISQFGSWALIDTSHTCFEPVGEISKEKISTSSRNAGEFVEYRYSQKYKFTGAEETDRLVQELMQHNNTLNTGNTHYGYPRNYAKDTMIKRVLVSMNIGTSELFINGQLKVEAAANMKRHEFKKMFSKSLDTDYQVKPASFLERIAAVVIIIIAVTVIVAVCTYSAGTGCTLATKAGMGTIAAALGAGMLVLAVGGMILGKLGGPSATGQVRMIGNFAQVIGLAAMIIGIFNFLTYAYKAVFSEGGKAVGQEAAGQAGTTAATNVTQESIVDQAIDYAQKQLSKAMEFVIDKPLEALNNLMKWAENGYKMYVRLSDNNPTQTNIPQTDDTKSLQIETMERIEERITIYDALNAFEEECIIPYTQRTRFLITEIEIS